MKKTFNVKATIGGHIHLDEWAGQTVTITVESAEKEKPKVRMCDAGCGCDKPARWEITRPGYVWPRCDKHIADLLCAIRTNCTIAPIPPIPPQPPEPIVVEWEINCRDQTSTLIKVPTILENKRIKVRLTEVPD